MIRCFVCGDEHQTAKSKTVMVVDKDGCRLSIGRSVALCDVCFPVTETVDVRVTTGK